jgi:hypothetical protein
MNISIIEFTIDFFKNIDIDFEFRDWIYVKIMISLSIKDNEAQVCLDTDCNVILTNRNFIKINESHYIIRRMTISLNVRELKTNKHEILKYIIAIIYFSESFAKDEKFIREMIRREIHLMNNLKINMFIENDILDSEKIFIDDVNNKVIIVSCEHMIILIEIKTFSKDMINKILHVKSITIISTYFMIAISIYNINLLINLLINRNFLFEFKNVNVSLFAHTIDSFTKSIIVKNDFNYFVKTARNDRLDTIIEIQYSNAFHANHDIKDYAKRKFARAHKASWFKRVLKTTMIVYIAVVAIFFTFERKKSSNVILSNDVIVHSFTAQTVTTLFDLIDRYSDL